MDGYWVSSYSATPTKKWYTNPDVSRLLKGFSRQTPAKTNPYWKKLVVLAKVRSNIGSWGWLSVNSPLKAAPETLQTHPSQFTTLDETPFRGIQKWWNHNGTKMVPYCRSLPPHLPNPNPGISLGIRDSWCSFVISNMGVSENNVRLNPMVLLILIPIKWLFHWEYTQHFQTNPYDLYWSFLEGDSHRKGRSEGHWWSPLCIAAAADLLKVVMISNISRFCIMNPPKKEISHKSRHMLKQLTPGNSN